MDEGKDASRFKIVTKKEERNWELPGDLADYANTHFRDYIPINDIEEDVLTNHPVPTNILEVKKLYDFAKSLLATQTKCLNNDSTMENFQKRIRQVLGPLSRLWTGIMDKSPNKKP